VLCPYCLNYVTFNQGKNENICPKCKQEVPTIYVQDTKTKRVTVSAVGFSGHGKTVCFASLFYFSDRLSDFWPDFSYMALDDRSMRIIRENSNSLSIGILPPPTPNNFPIPAIINFMKIPLFGDRIFLFYDIGGESVESMKNIATYASFIKNSRMMTFFISLSDLNEKIKESGVSIGGEMRNLLNAYIGGHSRIEGKAKSQDLLVVFTKGDRLKDILPKDVWEYIRSGASEIYGDDNEFSNNDMLRHIKQMKSISNSLQNFADKKLNGRVFINLAKNYFKNVNFMVVSSLGTEPAGGKVSPIPKRVEDILLWLAYSQETNTFTKIKMKLRDKFI